MENWKIAPTKEYRNLPQTKSTAERQALAQRFKDEFSFIHVPLIIECVMPDETQGLGYFLCGKDRLWLGAFQKDDDNKWKLLWKSGEIPYEYDMGRLKLFLRSLN